jgi:hypothetical protein
MITMCGTHQACDLRREEPVSLRQDPTCFDPHLQLAAQRQPQIITFAGRDRQGTVRTLRMQGGRRRSTAGLSTEDGVEER